MTTSPRIISNPRVHILDEDDAYAVTQTSDDIRDGDVLVVPSAGVVAVMVGAWPTTVVGDGSDLDFHTLDADVSPSCLLSSPGRYDASLPVCPRHDQFVINYWPLTKRDAGRDYSASWRLAHEVAGQR
jgi:hypothetical protein